MCIDIVLIFFLYSGPSGIVCFDGKQNAAYAGARGARDWLHFLLVLMKRLNKTRSAVFLYCRFCLFLKDLFFQIIYLLYLDFFMKVQHL